MLNHAVGPIPGDDDVIEYEDPDPLEEPLDEYLALFSGANREKVKFMALASSVLRQAVDLMSLVLGMPEAYSLPCAVGKQLDCLAATLGLTRVDSPQGAAATDAEFRAFIQDRLALWRTDGTNGSNS